VPKLQGNESSPRDAAVDGKHGMNQHWRQLARCLGADPRLFYPVSDEDAEPAIEICMLCPVREACLEHALVAREREGVWGGLTERERRRVERRRRRSA
jgi:WhiB family redox-sensing transcriptional regulator